MPKAVGLPGTKRDKEAVFVGSLAKLAKVIRAKQYATDADDNGAIGAWIDDAGKYRCMAHRHLATIDDQTFSNLEAVKTWWKIWRKKIA